MNALLERLDGDIALGAAGGSLQQQGTARALFQQLVPNPGGGHSCTLTSDGFPLLFTYSTADDRLRWKCDLNPNGSPKARLAITREIFQRLSRHATDLPEGGSTRFGAWLGGAIETDGRVGFRLYQEPTEQQEGPLRSNELAGFRRHLRVVGYTPGSEHREYIYRFDNSSPFFLRRLMDVAGLLDHAEDALGLLTAQSRREIVDTLPGTSVAASFAYDRPGATPTLTLHLFARALWGGDAAIRKGFLDLLHAAGRDGKAYAVASASLENYTRAATWHDRVSLTFGKHGHDWALDLRPIRRPNRGKTG